MIQCKTYETIRMTTIKLILWLFWSSSNCTCTCLPRRFRTNSTILVYFVGICFKDTVVIIHKWFLLHLFPQICEITAANDSIMGEKRGKMTKNFLNPQKFPQTASVRLDLFSCLRRRCKLQLPKTLVLKGFRYAD